MTQLGETLRLLDSEGQPHDWLVVRCWFDDDSNIQQLGLVHIPEGKTAMDYGRSFGLTGEIDRVVSCLEGTARLLN